MAVINGDQSRFRIRDFNSTTTFVRVQTNFDVGPSMASIDYPISDDAIVQHQLIIPSYNLTMYMSIRVYHLSKKCPPRVLSK